ncbi:MAG: hypothetical protein II822_09930 [Prevotella sp.]|nr:hypothetical protein [Prevotella sp.]
MIRIQKSAEPQVLIENKEQWTNNLMELVAKYKGYNKIPPKIRDAAIRYYKHEDIVNALKGNSGNAKCVYCESYVDVTCYANIEHYHPKSIYPNETFCWDNLFVGCTRCNTPKNSFDTGQEPFVHPVEDAPEEYLTFDDIMYAPKYVEGESFEKAKNVIESCDLKRISLIQAHALILVSYMKSCKALTKSLEEYNNHRSTSAKQKDALSIYLALITLKNEASDDAQYAGFMRYLLRKSPEVRDAVQIVNQHKDDIGLANDFDWGFSFDANI